MFLLPNVPDEVPAYSVVENDQKKGFYILLLNRAALQFLSKAHFLNICSSHSSKPLQGCLSLFGQAKRFDIEEDEQGKKR